MSNLDRSSYIFYCFQTLQEKRSELCCISVFFQSEIKDRKGNEINSLLNSLMNLHFIFKLSFFGHTAETSDGSTICQGLHKFLNKVLKWASMTKCIWNHT